MRRDLIRLLAATALCAAVASSTNLHAGMVTYSGTADFYIDATSPDPWGFGNPAEPTFLDFEFNLTVDDAPSPVLGTSIPQIRPDVGGFIEGSITVDGALISIVDLTDIFFADNTNSGAWDFVKFQFDAVHNGITLDLLIRYTMSNTTFTLSGPSDSPPTFAPHSSVYAEYAGGGGYQLRTVRSKHSLSGTAISPVPEPSSLVLLGMGATGVGILRRRRMPAAVARELTCGHTIDLN